MATHARIIRRPARPSSDAVIALAAGAALLGVGLTVLNRRRSDDTRVALAGSRGLNVKDAIRLERPIAEVYRYWRQLENLPAFMTHLESVTQVSPHQSRWVAKGPAGIRVEWYADIINEVENKLIAWRSLPGSSVVTAGSVNFDTVRAGRSTQVTVNLQYAPPAGKAGAAVAAMFGRAPSQTIREDLRRLKQRLEAGELAQAGLGPDRSRS
jgi:uncharacterized membrane protein